MPTYLAHARWDGPAAMVRGRVRAGSGALRGSVSHRPVQGEVTNPSELIGAALASDFAIALSRRLRDAGCIIRALEATASVEMGRTDGQTYLSRIRLDVHVSAEGISAAQLADEAAQAWQAGPMCTALVGATVEVHTHLRS